MSLKKSCIIFLAVSMFWSCTGKKEKTTQYEVRDIDLRVTDEEKAALNFLAVNMDPFVEEAISPNEGDIASQTYFYFNIRQDEQSIIIKKEDYFDFNRAARRLEFKELRVVRYVVMPIELLTPENILVEQQVDELSYMWLGYYPYRLEVSTLYNKPVKRITVWYTTGNGDKPNKIQKTEEDTIEGGFVLNFKSNAQKAALFAANFKKLCSIK